MTRNIKGLMHALQQSINEAILESNDVAAAMAALKRTGKCPVFTIDISMQDPSGAESEIGPADGDDIETIDGHTTDCHTMQPDMPVLLEAAPAHPERTGNSEELVLSDSDVEFLAALGVTDPSWGNTTYNLPRE